MPELISSYRKAGLPKPVLFLLLLFVAGTGWSGEYDIRLASHDVVRYDISIEVNDTTNHIQGVAGVELMIREPAVEIILDLAGGPGNGTGMTVDSVFTGGKSTSFTHADNRLSLPAPEADTMVEYRIYYGGVVEDGIIISTNMYGDRTFFADNWPDRARNWFPCIDHPSSRAMVDFTITAPSHYQVIATGTLKKRINLPGKRTAHYWSSDIAIPTKVMVFGAAPFAVEFAGTIEGIPYSNWVYPQNVTEGFASFSATPEIVKFFTELIGPYPFEKIANVQSTTRYGGMENAGNIFYHEQAVAADRDIEYLIVHEMAHQWFGNSVSETDWPHLWLSEGLATWLTDWYYGQQHGMERLHERMAGHRTRIIEHANTRLAPVVDHHPESLVAMLNPNTYQKGSWVLHMLRRKTGSDILLQGISEYYDRYRDGHACSEKFQKVMEEVSGTDLDQFFDDWIYSAGHPVVSVRSGYSNGRLTMELLQTQQHKMAFTFPLDVRFMFEDGSQQDHTFDIMFRRHEFVIDMPSEPSEIILDPGTWLLFEKR